MFCWGVNQAKLLCHSIILYSKGKNNLIVLVKESFII